MNGNSTRDELDRAAEKRAQAANEKRDVKPPANPDTGLVQRTGLPPKPKAFLYLDDQGRPQVGIMEADE